jgi:hypothetical protein
MCPCRRYGSGTLGWGSGGSCERCTHGRCYSLDSLLGWAEGLIGQGHRELDMRTMLRIIVSGLFVAFVVRVKLDACRITRMGKSGIGKITVVTHFSTLLVITRPVLKRVRNRTKQGSLRNGTSSSKPPNNSSFHLSATRPFLNDLYRYVRSKPQGLIVQRSSRSVVSLEIWI